MTERILHFIQETPFGLVHLSVFVANVVLLIVATVRAQRRVPMGWVEYAAVATLSAPILLSAIAWSESNESFRSGLVQVSKNFVLGWSLSARILTAHMLGLLMPLPSILAGVALAFRFPRIKVEAVLSGLAVALFFGGVVVYAQSLSLPFMCGSSLEDRLGLIASVLRGAQASLFSVTALSAGMLFAALATASVRARVQRTTAFIPLALVGLGFFGLGWPYLEDSATYLPKGDLALAGHLFERVEAPAMIGPEEPKRAPRVELGPGVLSLEGAEREDLAKLVDLLGEIRKVDEMMHPGAKRNRDVAITVDGDTRFSDLAPLLEALRKDGYFRAQLPFDRPQRVDLHAIGEVTLHLHTAAEIILEPSSGKPIPYARALDQMQPGSSIVLVVPESTPYSSLAEVVIAARELDVKVSLRLKERPKR